MALGSQQQTRIRLILEKDGTALGPQTLAGMTGYPIKDIRDFLRNERKKERRRNGDDPDKHRSQEYRKRKSVRGKRETLQAAFTRLLVDRPPDRDPAEHERIVRSVFADLV